MTFEEKKPTKWIKLVKKYMIDLHFTLHIIEYSKHQHIRRRIKEFDDKLWQEDLQKKNSLILHRKYKEIICDEICMIIRQQQLHYSEQEQGH